MDFHYFLCLGNLVFAEGAPLTSQKTFRSVVWLCFCKFCILFVIGLKRQKYGAKSELFLVKKAYVHLGKIC